MSDLPTTKQDAVLWLRYERGATIAQIAAWLKITRRAVLYRLQNARRRAGKLAAPIRRDQAASASRRRRYNASQISVPGVKSELKMEEM